MKRSRLRRTSKRRAAQLARYMELRKLYLSLHPKCQVCNGTACDIHHKAGRHNERLNDMSRFLAVCRSCHDMIHRHPAQARERGWLL